jgi:hypothetical protein
MGLYVGQLSAALWRFDHDELGILDGDILDGGAIARIGSHTVDLDPSRSRHEVAMPSFAERVFDGLSDFQRGTQHAGVDRQGPSSLSKPLASVTKRPERSVLGNGCRPPNRQAAIGARPDPSLEPERIERRRHLARWRAATSPQM